MADDRYIRWIKDALASNPHLSQAGLARHLDKSPSAISHLLNGRRQLKAHDIARIATYIGSSPPGENLVVAASPAVDPVRSTLLPARVVTGVRVMGRIAQRQWRDGDFVPESAETVPAAPDDRYPIEVQYALEVDPIDARAWPELGNHVIVVPIEHRPRPDPRDFVVVERTNANGHRNCYAARYDWHGGKLVPLDMDNQVVTDSPTWAVIASYKTLIR